MTPPEYRVDPAVFAAHPGYRRGVVVVADADNSRDGSALQALLRAEEARETPAPGEIVLCQGHAVLTRSWTWRQAAGTQTLPGTSAVFYNVDALPPVTDDDLRAAMRDIGNLAAAHTGGRVALETVLSA